MSTSNEPQSCSTEFSLVVEESRDTHSIPNPAAMEGSASPLKTSDSLATGEMTRAWSLPGGGAVHEVASIPGNTDRQQRALVVLDQTLEPPDRHAVERAIASLVALGALTADGAEERLTPLGRRLARLPTEPRFGKALLCAQALGCIHEVAVMIAAHEAPKQQNTTQILFFHRFFAC